MKFKLYDKINDKKKLVYLVIIIIILILSYICFFNYNRGLLIEQEQAENYYTDCNVAGITLYGQLYTYLPDDMDEDVTSADDIAYYVKEAEKADNIKAIIMEIDAYGGSPVASEEVANHLKHATKPLVTMIRDVGLSGAYWAATGADIIFASKNSDIGSIGVTMSYVDNVQKNIKEGLTYNQISSGKFKDYGSPDKMLSYEEKQLFQRDVDILHNNFIEAIAENRGMTIEEVIKLADGSSMTGDFALEAGLIDRIGGIYEVKDYIKDLINEDVEICW